MNNCLKKAAMMTDLHVGAKGGSTQHNEDCLEFAKWFCEKVKSDPTIDHIIDGGDFFDDRSRLSTFTLDYGYRISKMIDDLGLPWYRLVGNHSLANRNNRDVHNMIEFASLPNSIIINDITVVENLGERGAVLAPYLFQAEYPKLHQYRGYPYLYIHGEFNGFVLTGDSVVCEHGADHKQYSFFKRILSGHFHKAGMKDNVVYVGNCFPLNFADANDTNRGMSTFEYKTNKVQFINWEDAPTYVKCTLSKLLANPSTILRKKATVRCLVDIDLNYEESLELRANFVKKYELRELSLDEGFDIKSIVAGVEDDSESMDDQTMDNVIIERLGTVSSKGINTVKLIELYKGLTV